MLMALALLPAASRAQESDVKNILDYFKEIAQYDSRCTQEKVYLHLDNNAYFTDETIYFKAYVVRASSLKPTDLSKVLYVELLDDHGNTVERKSYEITDGQAEGSIQLSDLIHSGYYEIRAFTRAMLNWDGNYCFSRVVPIYQNDDGSHNLSTAYIWQETGEIRIPWKRKEPNTLRIDSADKNTFYVEFFPEGGARISGLEQRIAYRVTDSKGNPLDNVTCTVSNGTRQLASSSVQHEGMGSFILPADAGAATTTFTLNGNAHKFNLPSPRAEGVTATVERSDDKLKLNLSASGSLSGKLVGVSVTCRGAACHFDTIRLGGKTTWEMAESKLHYGINQITIFNSDGDILWERLVWRKPDYPIRLEVKQNEKSYKAFAPIVLDMKLTGKDGNPFNAYFSLAVHDRGLELDGSDIDAQSDLLLSSDLKGYISHPEQYFTSDDETHRGWLDLLMLVQGWRRYDWNEMSGKKEFVLKQPVEDGQLICGYLMNAKHKKVPMANVNVKANIYINTLHITGECTTDSQGNFSMLPPKYYGEGVGRFTVTDKDGKVVNFRLFLDRSFAPEPRMFDVGEMTLYKPQHKEGEVANNVFEWNDTITKGTIVLKEAKVTATLPGKDTWNGGEDFARRASDIVYNIDYENQKYCDSGEDDPLLWDLLEKINKYFEYYTTDDSRGIAEPVIVDGAYMDYATYRDRLIDQGAYTGAGTKYDFTYRGMPAQVFRSNILQDQDRINDLTVFASEVSRVYIATNEEKVRRVISGFGASGRETAIFLYGDGYAHFNLKEQKKTKVTRFYGYSSDPEFQGPDYRKRDMPNPKDLRRTLYWNPDVLADANGKATVIFYSNARDDVKLGITARAVLQDGEILDFEQ